MFCTKCGTESQPAAGFCQKCGTSLSDLSIKTKPILESKSADLALWNPNATANWSLLFTPAFGSYLQMLNWKSLGESEKAATSKMWFFSSLSMIIVYLCMGIFIKDEALSEGLTKGLGLFYLIAWYLASGISQSQYVKAKFGSNYARRPWGKALLMGIAAFAGMLILAAIVGVALGSIIGLAAGGAS